MRRSGYSRLVPVVVLAAVAGCGDLVGLLDLRPRSYVERDGLSYQVIVSESPYAYDAYEYRLRVTNTGYRTIERWLPADLATARVYRDGRWTYPVWSSCEYGCDIRSDEVRIRLDRGEAVEGWGGEVWTGDFAHRSGVYHLVLEVDTGDDRFEVLGLPAIRVY